MCKLVPKLGVTVLALMAFACRRADDVEATPDAGVSPPMTPASMVADAGVMGSGDASVSADPRTNRAAAADAGAQTADAGVSADPRSNRAAAADAGAQATDAGVNAAPQGTTGIITTPGTGRGTNLRVQSPNAGLTGSGPRGETGSKTGQGTNSKPLE